MSTPTTCPGCGCELEEGWENVYQCGSSFYTEGPQAGLVERASCWKRQRDQLCIRVAELQNHVETLKAERNAAGMRERNQLLQKVQRLEEAGDFGYCALGFADDDIREHLQVANYNLHGLLNTGEKIQRPNPPQTIHQEGIDASCRVRSLIAESRRMWTQAKETKP